MTKYDENGTMTTTRAELEAALDAGRLQCRSGKRNRKGEHVWYKLRRNGKTKLWKTRPNEFEIPYKVGFREYGRLTHTNSLNTHFLRIVKST